MNEEKAFRAALLDPELPPPDDILAGHGAGPTTRFGVYRNNVVVSLVDALADSFPVTLQLVGERFFRAMARLFAVQSPPDSPVMNLYGADFPAFIERFGPAATVPYLADVARLEYLRIRAFHAADARPMDVEALAAWLADSERLPQLRARLHPSAQLLVSDHAVVSIWSAHQQEGDPKGFSSQGPERALVIRPELRVHVVPLDHGSWHFAAQLQQGLDLGGALESTADVVSGFDPGPSLALLIRNGLITSLQPPAESTS